MIAVVIPVYNDPEGISTTLDSLLDQSTDRPHQIHVVDNGSTDSTVEIGRSYTDVYNHVILHRETNIRSSYAARNTGIQHTDADLLAFLDADMTVPDGWLEDALEAFEANDTDYMGTNVELQPPPSPSFAARYDRHTGFPVEHYLTQQLFAPTCCLFVRRSVFEDVGLFDPRLTSGGDKEFGNRVGDAGYDLHYAEDVTVYHPTRDTIRDLVAKDARVGRGLCQLQRYHPERYGRPGIPPRPSGAKRSAGSSSLGDRFAFGLLGTMLTGMRGLGYYAEFASPTPAPDIDGIPRLG